LRCASSNVFCVQTRFITIDIVIDIDSDINSDI